MSHGNPWRVSVAIRDSSSSCRGKIKVARAGDGVDSSRVGLIQQSDASAGHAVVVWASMGVSPTGEYKVQGLTSAMSRTGHGARIFLSSGARGIKALTPRSPFTIWRFELCVFSGHCPKAVPRQLAVQRHRWPRNKAMPSGKAVPVRVRGRGGLSFILKASAGLAWRAP
jgi:hypothetical protein